MLASILVHVITLFVEQSRNPPLKLANSRLSPTSEFTISCTKTDLITSQRRKIQLNTRHVEIMGGGGPDTVRLCQYNYIFCHQSLTERVCL